MEDKELKTYLKVRKELREINKIRFHNLKEHLKPLVIIPIGLVLSLVFFLAGLFVMSLIGEKHPLETFAIFVTLIFLYGAVFHDVIQPYVHQNLKEEKEIC